MKMVQSLAGYQPSKRNRLWLRWSTRVRWAAAIKTGRLEVTFRHLNNAFGRLNPEVCKRLKAVAVNPNQQTWSAAYGIIINWQDRHKTLWQAVIQIDPTFPKVGPCNGESWKRITTQEQIMEALLYSAFCGRVQ